HGFTKLAQVQPQRVSTIPTKTAMWEARAAYDWFRTAPPYMRQNMAGIWGFDEKTMLAMTAGVDKFAEHYKKVQRSVGLDPEKAAENGNKLMTAWRSIWNTFTTIVEGALAKLLGPGGENLTALSNWFDEHAKQISDALSEITKGFLEALKGWKEGLGDVDWKEAGKGVAEFAKDIGHLVANLRDLTKWAVDAANAVNKFGQDTGLEWLLNKLAYYGPPNEHQGTGGPADAGAGDGEKPGFFRRAWNGTKKLFGMGAEAAPAGAGGRIGKAVQSENAKKALAALLGSGLPPEGVAAAMGSAQSESSFNPHAHNDVKGGHTGLFQWDSTRWPKIARWIKEHGGNPWDAGWQSRAYVAESAAKPGDQLYDTRRTEEGGRLLRESAGDIAKAMDGIRESERYGRGEEGGRGANARAWLPHVREAMRSHGGGLVSHRSANERAGRHHAEPQSTFNPADAWHTYQRGWAPGAQSFNNSSSSSSSAALHANTTINVHGGNADAGTIAQSVAANQSRVNANLIRNLQGAVA
ncbi:phage tail tip lysozyme, partial [Rhodoblastus sphagnicola]